MKSGLIKFGSVRGKNAPRKHVKQPARTPSHNHSQQRPSWVRSSPPNHLDRCCMPHTPGLLSQNPVADTAVGFLCAKTMIDKHYALYSIYILETKTYVSQPPPFDLANGLYSTRMFDVCSRGHGSVVLRHTKQAPRQLQLAAEKPAQRHGACWL